MADWAAIAAAAEAAAIGTFGEPAVLTPEAGAFADQDIAVTVVAELGDQTVLAAEEGEGVIVARPHAGLAKASLPAGLEPVAGDRLTLRGEAWKVTEVHDDRSTHLTLHLRQVAP